MKLITNSAEIKVTENEDGSKSFQGIGSEVGVENLNGIILTPNCIEFARERYPLLYEHGAGSSEVIGDAKVYYDLASNKYLTDFTPVSYTHLTLPTKRIVEILEVAVSLTKKTTTKTKQKKTIQT